MQNTIASLPDHLRRYVVEQNYEKYTSQDQAVWRYIMRRLRSYLSQHAHPLYVEGLAKTGISVEEIPKISEMNDRLQEFGWGAVPVSGFIPPAAFMEFQSLGILPIASEMRSLDHVLYTPAPDIVHEAAGHAPILIDPDFAAYLKAYADVARHALISKEDLDQYEAIRILSDVKENPESTASEIQSAEKYLEDVNSAMTYVSEAGWLSRMNWWTAEYGLVGNLQDPKLYGAGLLSSVGESKDCLTVAVQKIPLSVDCIYQSYDITEQQPQLFVTPNFEHLQVVLDDLAKLLAFRIGGAEAMKRGLQTQTVNTVQLDSGLQFSGLIDRVETDENGKVCFFHLDGKSQIARERKQLTGHGPDYHAHGYSTPIGHVETFGKPLNQMSKTEYESLGLKSGKKAQFRFASGIEISGVVEKISLNAGRLDLVTFKDCTVKKGDELLFMPDWGTFDLACGGGVTSVFAGPADRSVFPVKEDFVAQRVQSKTPDEKERSTYKVFEDIRDLRAKQTFVESDFTRLITDWDSSASGNWLAALELLEIGKKESVPENQLSKIEESFNSIDDPAVKECIKEGRQLITEL